MTESNRQVGIDVPDSTQGHDLFASSSALVNSSTGPDDNTDLPAIPASSNVDLGKLQKYQTEKT